MTRENVIAVAPELEAVAEDDSRWAAFIADVDLFVAKRNLGATRADTAKKYLVAHWMTASVLQEAEAEAETGPLKSVTIGPVTKTYDTKAATGAAATEDFKSTRYGAMFLQLIRVAGIGVR